MIAPPPPPLDLDAKLVRALSTTHEIPDSDETVLFDEQGSELIVLNSVGAAIWYLADGTRSVREMLQFVEAEIGPVPDDARARVLSFVTELLERGALRVVSP